MFVVKSFDDSKRKNGTWINYNELDPSEGVFKIASISSFAFQNFYSKLQAQAQGGRAKKELDAETQSKILCQALAKHVLLDWKNVSFTEDGSETAYTAELAYEALLSNPELLSFVQDKALDISNFKADKQEEELKNSVTI